MANRTAVLVMAITLCGFTLPPPEYDKPYYGPLYHMDVHVDVVRALCPRTPKAVACTFYNHGTCVIMMADSLRARPRDRDLIWRHEIGHCNGWKHDPRDANRTLYPVRQSN